MSINESTVLAQETVDLGHFTFSKSPLAACAHLVAVTKHAAPEKFSGKLILNESLPEFLKLEGAVHRVLRTHPHPNILQPITVVGGAELSGVVFPAVGEDLHTHVRARKGLPEREAKSIFRSILSAVSHCHRHRIVLRDVRLGKMFFKHGSSSEVVIGDLEGAQVVSHASPFLSDRKGSPAFVSPEVLVSHAFDGAAADMWGLGVILYILLTGNYPFQDSQIATLFQKIQQGHAAVFFPQGMSEAARDIIRSLLMKEPHLRLTAEELSHDLWLRDATPSINRELNFDFVIPFLTEPVAPAEDEKIEQRKRRSSGEFVMAKRARSETPVFDNGLEEDVVQ
jgi:serine/threonine protein kinase